MFSGSSQDRRLANPDGSRNVYCFTCGEFISKTYEAMNRAQCDLCRRVLGGEVLTEQAIREYNQGKQVKSSVTMVNLTEHEQTPSQAKKFSLRSMTGEFVRAFKAVIAPKPTEENTPSIKVSKTKRRGRLFDSVDLNEEPSGPVLGSMVDVDAQLRADREKQS